MPWGTQQGWQCNTHPLNVVRGMFLDPPSAVTAKCCWDCPIPDTAAPKPIPPDSSGSKHLLLLCPFFKVVSAHQESTNEQKDFGFPLGVRWHLWITWGTWTWWGLLVGSGTHLSRQCSCSFLCIWEGAGVLLLMEFYHLKIWKLITCWLVGLALIFRFLVLCARETDQTGLSDLLDLLIFHLVALYWLQAFF